MGDLEGEKGIPSTPYVAIMGEALHDGSRGHVVVEGSSLFKGKQFC